MKFITTPIFYPNDKPHLGHAYTAVIADFLTRYYRQKGEKVKFSTGLDEHGQKIAKTAAQKNVSPQEYVDGMAVFFKQLMSAYDVEYDVFVRTTDDKHKRAVQYFWRSISRFIYKGKYKGWYSVSDENFIKEDEVKQLRESGKPVQWVAEDCYFFKLSAFSAPLLEYFKTADIYPHANELKMFVEGGLKDIAISRASVKWGIDVPYQATNAIGKCVEYMQNMFKQKQTIYVWLDALTNYLTAIGYPLYDKHYWDNSIHIVGKDIAKFHGIYWPAFLMAAGISTPKTLLVHGWWLTNDSKMSKSQGDVVEPIALLEKYNISEVRWFFLREMSFGQDANFTFEQLNTRSAELSNVIGNLIHRSLQLLIKKYQGVVLAASEVIGNSQICHDAIKDHKLHLYAQGIHDIASECNRYIDHRKPWASEDGHQVLSNVVHALREMAKLLYPIMPEVSAKLSDWIAGDVVSEPEILWPRSER